MLREIIQDVTRVASTAPSEGEKQKLKLQEAISLDDLYYDTTCVKANIHFPVDWVLLRDAVRTLMKSVKIIRSKGLKNRMAGPAEFIRQINKLSIEMTHSCRRKAGKITRKKPLRIMKEILKKVAKHALKHKILLEEHCQETGLTQGQTKQILKRIENVLRWLSILVF